jgi:fatty-acyl-CoA synthase
MAHGANSMVIVSTDAWSVQTSTRSDEVEEDTAVSTQPTVEQGPVSLAGLLRTAASSWPDRVVAAFPDEQLTYRALWQGAVDVGQRLARAGIAPGDHVGLLLPNSARFLCVLFGAELLGAVPVPLNTRYRTDELPYVVEHADLAALITSCDIEVTSQGVNIDYAARIDEAFPGLGASETFCPDALTLRFVAGFGPAHHDWITPWPEVAILSADDPAARPALWMHASSGPAKALMLYTSGTTSRPKGVQNSHRALIHMALAGGARMGLNADSVIWSPAPMCHIGSFVALIATLAVGARFVSAPHFQADSAIELLSREHVTIAYAGFPAFYFDLANRLRETGRELPHLEILTTAAAPAEIARVRAGFPDVLQLSVTGSTELSGSICISEATDTPEQRATTAGRPIEGVELSIRDDSGVEVAAGQTGELWVRGLGLLSGYYKDPAPLLSAPPDPGWFRTGDLGAMLDGRLAFRGRLKDMVKVGGENVSAAEVENFLLTHSAIALAQVVGAPDDRLGEIVVAFVELVPGRTLTTDEVLVYCRDSMAAYKIPRAVTFVTEWPMSTSKISKAALRELARASRVA